LVKWVIIYPFLDTALVFQAAGLLRGTNPAEPGQDIPGWREPVQYGHGRVKGIFRGLMAGFDATLLRCNTCLPNLWANRFFVGRVTPKMAALSVV
jgi:hypothetical protein